MHKLVMRFLTATEGKYFTLTVDDLKADENGFAICLDDNVITEI